MSPNLRRSGLPFIVHVFTAFSVLVAVGALTLVAGQSHARTQRARRAAICGNPTIACKTSVPFEPYDLPFRVPKNAVIIDTEPFYAIILKSLPAKVDSCDLFISEAERLAAQALFPDKKIFTSRCAEPENLFYLDETRAKGTNISETHRIMAVYAGTSLADARRVLGAVKATGKFPGANLRRMRTGFNGT